MSMALRYFEELDSTMSKARELCGTGDAGTFFGVLADRQSAGRGRIAGRTWEAAPGKALLLTLALKDSEASFPALPLKAGLAAYDTFVVYGADLAVKWPNDLLARPRGAEGRWKKMAGILCERTGGWTLVGLGANLFEGAFPADMEDQGTSLEACTLLPLAAISPSSLSWRLSLCRAFGEAFLAHLGDQDWHKKYLQRMWGLSSYVGFRIGHPSAQEVRKGVIAGIDGEGSLLIQDASGFIAAYGSGEIETLRPA